MKKTKKLISVLLSLLLLMSCFSVAGTAEMTVTDDISAVDLTELDSMTAVLEEKISQCEANGLTVQKEKSKLTLLKLFKGYLQEDVAIGASSNLSSTLTSLNYIYSQCLEQLNKYLSGEETPLAASTYKTGSVRIDGDDIYVTTSSGEELYYFTGFGFGQQVIDDMEQFEAMGFCAMQIEVGPKAVIVEKDKGDTTGLNTDDEFSVDTSYITGYVIPVLEKAASCNVLVSVLLSPHYFPKFLYDIYSDLHCSNKGFQKYSINHPVAKRVISVYLETLIPMIKDYPSVLEFCLTNEPNYRTSLSDYDIAAWQEYLTGKYSDIRELNSLWGTRYKSFDEVIMPKTEQASALMYEWVVFNNDFYSQWHSWMAAEVKKYAPDIPVSAKTMSYTDNASQRIMYGVNVEQFSAFSDMNGSNGWNTLYSDNTAEKMEAYDLLDSISSKPIINSEDHVIYDASSKYFSEEDALKLSQHCYADVWQGAVHGRNAGIYWIWERSQDASNSTYNSILMRPLTIAAMSDAAFDVNRLSGEINALNSITDEPDVYILFSDTTRVYSRMSSDFVETAYKGAVYAGKTVKFVTENTISDMKDGKLLIVPNCTNVPDSTLQAIKSYCEKGNEVLLLGRCLKDNEYDNSSDLSALTYIYTHATVYGSNPLSKLIESLMRAVRWLVNIFTSITGREVDYDFDYAVTKNITGELYAPGAVLLVDAGDVSKKIVSLTGEAAVVLKDANGKAITGCEIRTARYNGKIIVNVCSYTWDGDLQNVSVYYNGARVEMLSELISQKTISSSFTVSSYEPLLLEFAA